MGNKVEVLVATMNQEPKDYSLLDKMNIQSDVIVGNQCDRNEIGEFHYKGNKARYLSFAERGVGLNRNNSLMRTTGEILLFADDDMIYANGYVDIVKDVFESNPNADVVIFNIDEKVPKRAVIKKKHYTKKIGYGAARIACRRKVIQNRGIFFNLCFGGGTAHSSGEDTLFLAECVHKGLNILCVPQSIAELTEDRPSTWFEGYTDKYFYDTGFLLTASNISFLVLRFIKGAFVNSRKGNGEFWNILRFYLKGMRDYRKKVH